MAKEKFSYKVKCSKCGEQKFTNPQAYQARLKKFGSREKIEKEWKCRGRSIGTTINIPKKKD